MRQMADEGLEVDRSHINLVANWFPELKPHLVKDSKSEDGLESDGSQPENKKEGVIKKQKGKHPKAEKQNITDQVALEINKHVKHGKQKQYRQKKEVTKVQDQNGDVDDADSKVAMVTAAKERSKKAGPATTSSLLVEDLQNKLKDKISKSAKKRLRKRINKLRNSLVEDKDKGRSTNDGETTSEKHKISDKSLKKNSTEKDKTSTDTLQDERTNNENIAQAATEKPSRGHKNKTTNQFNIKRNCQDQGQLKRKLHDTFEKVESMNHKKQKESHLGDLPPGEDDGAKDTDNAATKPFKRKRKKKRSKQKNIKKDNRPDHMKPPHLRAKPEEPSDS
ncbi:uncharacterized protein LOC106161471 [Lingula anatina]|uniref:Uncharacterized protein LOC106161471 n=1 Tax=Lingula anatina TaxID=7574 RepID=A0A1S3I920_LINAN|nr:uncharacterized protein LOC106161471 [Lingula anatina]|eukprot:XP_013393884.1 uncharacterized protein LOC106161471 [Lingula anatina]